MRASVWIAILFLSIEAPTSMAKEVHFPSFLYHNEHSGVTSLKPYKGSFGNSTLDLSFNTYFGNFDDSTPKIYNGNFENSTLKLIERREDEDLLIRNRQRRGSVGTDCINPTMNNMDECIENTDPGVVEKCVPGLVQRLIDEGGGEMADMQHIADSEACLQQAFERCSHDSRYRIKTKIQKIAGVTLDIDFQDEFEMDDCDQESINEVMNEVQNCFQNNHQHHQRRQPSGGNISTEIIQMAGQCIEDHTAFMCALKDKNIFRSAIQQLISMLRDESLNILDKNGRGSNHTRLCLMWMDYNRLENCESDFFDYVQCLQNGTNHPTLFRNVQECFRNALRVCPPSTAQALIKILAGAIEGKAGEEPQSAMDAGFARQQHHPYHPVDESCTEDKISHSIQNIIHCARNMIANQPKETSLASVTTAIGNCAKSEHSSDCKYHKFSTFRSAIHKLHDAASHLLQQVKDNACVKSFTDNEADSCIVKLFLYYFNSQHSHHTQQSLKKQLNKMKLCFQVEMKGCKFHDVDSILQMYASLVGIHLPRLVPLQILTKVTLPQGSIWCETRAYGDDVPLPGTKQMDVTPGDHFWEQYITPTTVSQFDFTPPGGSAFEEYPEVNTDYMYVPHAPHGYNEYGPAVEVQEIECIIRPKHSRVTYPPRAPDEHNRQPMSPTEHEEHVTPTEVYRKRIKIIVIEVREEKRAHQPEQNVVTPVEETAREEHLTPTTSQPYVRGVKSKTVYVYKKNVIVEVIEAGHKPEEHTESIIQPEFPRQIYPVHSKEETSIKLVKIETIHRYAPRRNEQIEETSTPTTTRSYEHTPGPKIYPKESKKIIVIVEHIPSEEKPDVEESVTPTTVQTLRRKPITQVEIVIIKAVSHKVEHFYPSEEECEHEEHFTTERIYAPRREMEQSPESITPTTVSHVRIIVKEMTPQGERPLPDIEYATHLPMETPYEESRTPTTVSEYEFIVTEREETHEMPEAPTREMHVPHEENHYYEVVKPPQNEYERKQPQPVPYEEECVPTESNFHHYPVAPGEMDNHQPYNVKIIKFPQEQRGYDQWQPQTTVRTMGVPLIPRKEVRKHEMKKPTPKMIFPENKVYIQHRTTQPPRHFTYESPEEVNELRRPPVIPDVYEQENPCPDKSPEEAFLVVPGYEIDTPLCLRHHQIPGGQGPSDSGDTCMQRCISGQSEECQPGHHRQHHHQNHHIDTIMCCAQACGQSHGSPMETCKKLCLKEDSFECRAAVFNQDTNECCLSKEDNRTRPDAVHKAPSRRIIYLENHCLPEREVITPTTTKEMWSPPTPRVHGHEITPHEIHVVKYPVPVFPEHKKRKLPPIHRMIITRPEVMRTRYETPPTQKSKHRVPVSPMEKSMPLPKIEVETRTPNVQHTQRIPGVKYKVYHFAPKEQKYETTLPAATPHSEMFMPTRTESYEHRTPTPTSHERFPVEAKPYTESKPEERIRVIQLQPQPVTDQREEKVPTPRMSEYIPREHQHKQQMPKDRKEQKIVVKVQEVTNKQPAITPEMMDITPAKKIILRIFKPTPKMQFDVQPMESPKEEHMPRPKIFVVVYTPQEKHFEEEVTKSTVSEMHATPTPHCEEFEYEATTTRPFVRPIIPHEEENQIQAPQPEIIHILHIPSSTEDFRYPTTTESFRNSMQTDVLTQSVPVSTEIMEYPRSEVIRIMHGTPPSVKDYDIPASEDSHSEEMPAQTPKVWSIRPRTPPYVENIPQTTTSVYHRTVTEWNDHQRVPQRPTGKYHDVPETEQNVDTHIAVTEITIIKAVVKQYTCSKGKQQGPYETGSTISCKAISRKCSTTVFQKWKIRIEKCVAAMMIKDRVSLKGKTTKETVDLIHEYVLKCIRKIGDTPCRNKKMTFFDLKLENSLIVLGADGEGQTTQSPQIMDDDMFSMQKCVAMADEHQLESCCPGLYHVLSSIILYRNPIQTMNLKKSPPPHCITKNLGHCDHETRQNMEHMVHNSFGNACIRLTTPDEPTTCKIIVRKTRAGGECDAKALSDFLQSLRSCMSAEHGGGTIGNLLENLQNCTSPNMPHTCIIRRWVHVQRILHIITDYLLNNTAEIRCTHQITSNETAVCLQSLVDLIPSIPEVVDSHELMRPIVGCVNTAMTSCTPDTTLKLIQFVLFITDAEPIDVHNIEVPVLQSSISSIKQNDLDVSICQDNIRNPGKHRTERPTFSDDCVPVYPDFSSRPERDAGSQPQYILVKTCNEDQVNKWLKELEGCVEDKTTRIGLRNPEYLTLPRLLIIIKTCIDHQGPLKCRPKYLPDFKRIIKSIVDMARQNSLTSQNGQCLQQLKIESFPRCIHLLHRFLALTTDEKFFIPNQKKAMHCLQEYLKNCDKSTVEQLFDVQELAMVQEASTLYRYSDGDIVKCSPAYLRFDSSGVFDDLPMMDECGPGEEPVRKPREVPTSRELLRGYQPRPGLKVLKREDWSTSPRECNTHDYASYLVELKNCAKKRLYLKYRKAKDSCHLLSVKELFDAMTECGIEVEVNPLPCVISSEEHMSMFLSSFSKVLKTTGKTNHEMCSEHQSCVLNETPPLQECSRSFYEFTETGYSEMNHLRKIINGTLEAQSCLTSIWNNCPTEVSSLTISIVLNALELDFDSAMAEGSKFVSCRTDGLKEAKLLGYIKSLNCLKNTTIDENGSTSDFLDVCKHCVMEKEGICMYNNVTDMLQVVEADVLAISRCLNKFQFSEGCIRDVTERVTDACLPHFLKFVQHVKGGRILNLIDSLWEFNRCLVNFESECPEDFHQFVTETYYEVVGLSPFIHNDKWIST